MRRDPDLTARKRTVADLRTAAELAQRRHASFAALWFAIADAAEQTPAAARWGIPKDAVARDAAEELRWAAVVTRAHTLATAYVRSYAEALDLDAVLAGAPR